MRTILMLLMMTGAALADPQQADPSFLMKVIAGLQQQRNQALDMQAGAEAREAAAKEEMAKLKARLQELEAKTKPEESKPPSSP